MRWPTHSSDGVDLVSGPFPTPGRSPAGWFIAACSLGKSCKQSHEAEKPRKIRLKMSYAEVEKMII
jgi:hypothetical protein